VTKALRTPGLSCCAVAALAAAAVISQAAERRPNIVLMIADDQGWDGLSAEMAPGVGGSKSRVIQTPHLERLAAQGMRFSNGYAPAPVCSPTRISIQTGRSPAALHWTKAAPPEDGHPLVEPRLVKRISPDETTIGELLRAAGYATAHYGKWHIAGGGPEAHGYDESDGDTGNEQALRFTDPNPVDIFGMAGRAAAFMQKSRDAGRPFYVQLSWNALHGAQNARRATLEKYARLMGGSGEDKRTQTAALSEDLDEGVGRVLDAIERLGIGEDTYVIYTSDNGSGGGGKRGSLSGGKGSVWEGGIRVPFIVRGPGVAAGSWCHVPVTGQDLLPTFCEWAGVPAATLPRQVEGGSLAGLLREGGTGAIKRPREELVFHFPHYQSGNPPHSAIRLGDLKLIHFYEDDSVRLFDLGKDSGERRDLAAERPVEAARLRRRLTKYLADVGAQLPRPNPASDPDAAADPKPRGPGGTKKRKSGTMKPSLGEDDS
jgi:arylsulfatase A-like enzyme